MQEQLISFEIAALAEKMGLVYKDLDTHEAYDVDGNLGSIFYSDRHYKILAPTQSLLQRWLRERHDIHIEIASWINQPIDNVMQKRAFQWFTEGYTDSKVFKTYEEALEEGLKQALLIVKNI